MMKKFNQVKKIYGIRSRVIIFFLLLIILPFIAATLVITAIYQQYVLKQAQTSISSTMDMVALRMDDYLNDLRTSSASLYYNGCIDLVLQMRDGRSAEGGGAQDELERASVERYLSNLCFSRDNIHAAYLETKEGLIYHGGGDYSELFDFSHEMDRSVEEAGGRCCFFSTNQLHGRPNRTMYILARQINDEARRKAGILYMIFDDSYVRETLGAVKVPISSCYLMDEEGEILYSGDDDGMVSGEEVKYEQIKVESGLQYASWKCTAFIHVREVRHSIQQMLLPFLFLALVCLVFMAAMLYVLRCYVFEPLNILQKHMDDYAQNGLGNFQMEEVGTGEIRKLSEHFKRMTERIQQLMVDYKKNEEEKNRIQVKAMLSQLTPHFIYNALNTIKWMCVLNHQDNIQHLVESLIGIFKNAARMDDSYYLLADELELIKDYSAIQKARFMNFDLHMEVTEEAAHCHIRKMLIQPIVENAIVHGLGKGMIKDTVIRIDAWVDGSCIFEEKDEKIKEILDPDPEKLFLHLVVCDEGSGFDVAAWENKNKSEQEEDHTNIGIHNVKKIISLEYGDPYGLHIESAVSEGTKVVYLLPAERAKEKRKEI